MNVGSNDLIEESEEFKIGRKLYFGTFLSTTIDREVAEIYSSNNGLLFIITIKNNEQNNYCYQIQNVSNYPDEVEILITAFSLFTITNVVKNNSRLEIYLDCYGFKHDE